MLSSRRKKNLKKLKKITTIWLVKIYKNAKTVNQIFSHESNFFYGKEKLKTAITWHKRKLKLIVKT